MSFGISRFSLYFSRVFLFVYPRDKIQPEFELRKTFFIQRSICLRKFSISFLCIASLFYFIPIYFMQFPLKSFYWITWVISLVCEFFHGLSTISNTFKCEEYVKVIEYVSLDNICFELSIYYSACDDMINCIRCIPCNTCWFIYDENQVLWTREFHKILKHQGHLLKFPTKSNSLLVISCFERIL